jgi:hypothetical protein
MQRKVTEIKIVHRINITGSARLSEQRNKFHPVAQPGGIFTIKIFIFSVCLTWPQHF